jgi:uncharacterized oxidoreductase
MPLDDFISETITALESDAPEVLVERARAFRENVGPKEHAFVDQFNQQILAIFS